MRISFADERVLAVVAHPDDAEYLCAGTLARAKQEDDAAIAILVLGQGDKGQPSVPIPRLAAVRRKEMTLAAGLLRAELFFGRVPDGHLADTPAQRRVLVEVFRRFRPTLVLAHNPADYHADHRAASALAEAASWFCASAGHKTQSAALATQPALWWMDTMNMAGFEPSLYIDVSEYAGVKRLMLDCHRSQLQRGTEGDFSPLAEQMLRQCEARGTQAGVAAAEAFRPHLVWKRARAW
jgi:LmbE family N-acetylglucosaminyl deacetylase